MKMTKTTSAALALVLVSGLIFGQAGPLEKTGFLLGEWHGTGSGFGNQGSTIESSFQWVMDGKYLEVINESWFGPSENNPEGEHHIDKGFISFDKNRNSIVYRQFNKEGFINQYLLNDSLSNDSMLVFETEVIENFMPGGKARWTIRKISHEQIETIFDVSFPDKGYTCFGTNNLHKKSAEFTDPDPRVTGIGGIFFLSADPRAVTEWYGKNLGLSTDPYGSVFEFRNANRPDEINYLRWSPFETGTEYMKPSEKGFMINYRVQNIEGLERKLRINGVTILDSIEVFDYGKFLHIMDPDGNKIELWEPVDSVLTQLGGQTTK